MHRFDGYNIELTRGDTLFFTLKLTGRDLPEGSVAYFTVKSGARSDEKLIEKKLDAGGEVLHIRLSSGETDLEPRTYFWDVRVLIPLEEGGYEVETPMEYAAFTILPAIGEAGDDERISGMDANLPVLSLLVREARETLDELHEAAQSGAFQGEQGPQGEPGEPGRDGVSPTVTCSAIPGGYRITVRDKDGAKNVDLRHGQDTSSNIENGAAYGSLRTVLAAPETDDYALGYGAFASGDQTKASGRFAVARGVKTDASGYDAYAEGINTVASGSNSHAEGSSSVASGICAHAEGMSSVASGLNAHAEGMNTLAEGQTSHAEGNKTEATGNSAHAEGLTCKAKGACAHAEGRVTVAAGDDQHAQGHYNIEDRENRYAHIVGNGRNGLPSNAHTLDWQGNAWFAGDVYVGGNGQDEGVRLMKEGEVPADLASKAYVDEAVAAIEKPVIPQPDWNENDPASSAYVKNRTHWLGSRKETIFSRLELTYDAESAMFLIPQPFALLEGGHYTVTWNGTAFECTGVSFEDGDAPMVVLGNVGLLQGTVPSEEPFLIAAAPPEYAQQGMYGVAMSFLEETAVTLSLDGDVEEPHELDAKFIRTALEEATKRFLPMAEACTLDETDEVLTGIMLRSAGGKRFRVYVDDNGALLTEAVS